MQLTVASTMVSFRNDTEQDWSIKISRMSLRSLVCLQKKCDAYKPRRAISSLLLVDFTHDIYLKISQIVSYFTFCFQMEKSD